MQLFNLDSPLMQFLSKMADLMILSLLTFFCCLPIITAGASLTAMHYMALKMARGEETYIVRGFFKSFRDNFRQSTIIWLLILFMAAILAADYYIVLHSETQVAGIIRIGILAVSILVIFVVTFVFPVQAKFANPVFRTIKNAFIISIMQFPKTILMVLLNLLPVILVLLSMGLVPIAIMFGMSVPAFLSAKLYNKFFKSLEDRIRETNGETDSVGDEDEHIFSDELYDNTDVSQNN